MTAHCLGLSLIDHLCQTNDIKSFLPYQLGDTLSALTISPTEPFTCANPFKFSQLCPCFSMSQIMQHHGCRSDLKDRNKLTDLEERLDLVVDSNDVILERVVWPRGFGLSQTCTSNGSLFKTTALPFLVSRGFSLMKPTGSTGPSSPSCLRASRLPRL